MYVCRKNLHAVGKQAINQCGITVHVYILSTYKYLYTTKI